MRAIKFLSLVFVLLFCCAYTWSVRGLPPELIADETGMISGVPTKAGVYNIQVGVKNNAGNTAAKTLRLTVDPARDILISWSHDCQLPSLAFKLYKAASENGTYELVQEMSAACSQVGVAESFQETMTMGFDNINYDVWFKMGAVDATENEKLSMACGLHVTPILTAPSNLDIQFK